MMTKILVTCKKCLADNLIFKKIVYLKDFNEIKIKCKCGNSDLRKFVLVSLNGDN